MSDQDTPTMLSRRTDTTELRGDCPKWIANVLDAVSIAKGSNRTALVNQILGEWADKKRHEASLIHKLAGLNPDTPECAGGQKL